MGGHRNIDDDPHQIGRQLYTPRYPVYNFNENGQQRAPHPEKILEKVELI